MKLVITIDLSNDAFQPNPGPEVGRILYELARDIKDEGELVDYSPIADVNGNIVGRYRLEE